MRVVFDTNVVLSAFLWGKMPAKALRYIREGKVEGLATQELLDELAEVLSRKKFARNLKNINQTVESLLDAYSNAILLVEPADIGRVVRDPKDDKFIACAVGGRAVLVVSGDSDLLTLQHYQDIEIITVAEFLNRMENP